MRLLCAGAPSFAVLPGLLGNAREMLGKALRDTIPYFIEVITYNIK